MKGKILFQLSGSIACYKACYLISKLVQEGFEVQTVATSEALKFIGSATLEGLSGKSVFSDTFQEGQMMNHIHFAKWADLAIVCPATANTINSLASGIANNCIGTLFLAYDLKKPYLIAPAMNKEMYQHPTTKASLEKLQSWNIHVLPTGEGHQACGDIGHGRLLEPDAIFIEILKFFKSKHIIQNVSLPEVPT
ncbi:MAG: flavoprotein [Oligoflexia bacterium]|nr:flavoprotein [Oligoflexia bacterium]